MLKVKIKNRVLTLFFQKNLIDGGVMVCVYDGKKYLFDMGFMNIPEIEEVKEELRIVLFCPDGFEPESLKKNKKTFKKEFCLLGDLFNPSLFGYKALQKNNQ